MFSKLKANFEYLDEDYIKWYSIKEPLEYKSDKHHVIVPINTMTDFATTPKWIHWLLKPQDRRYSKSSILHDHLYYQRDTCKFSDDLIFLEAMKTEQNTFISKIENKYKRFYETVKCFGIRWLFYISVSIFGWVYKNGKYKAWF